MFTGIISDIGRIEKIEQHNGTRFTICTHYDTDTILIGASIACNGTCLTVTSKGKTNGMGWFTVDVSMETLACTTLSHWRQGSFINLERPLKLGDELGGHLVLGHVDGVGTMTSVVPENGSHRITFAAPLALAPFIAEKGSITIDGVSLTVNKVDSHYFTVMIIPHTWEQTIFSAATEGAQVNMEIDMFARYTARLNNFTGKNA